MTNLTNRQLYHLLSDLIEKYGRKEITNCDICNAYNRGWVEGLKVARDHLTIPEE